MKKPYLSTVEESVDAQFEIAELLGTVEKLKWCGLVFAPLVFVALYFLLDNLVAQLIIGGSAAVLYALYHLSTFQRQVSKAPSQDHG